MVRLETLFRALLDAPDRGISLVHSDRPNRAYLNPDSRIRPPCEALSLGVMGSGVGKPVLDRIP